jgi:hypothetical protein
MCGVIWRRTKDVRGGGRELMRQGTVIFGACVVLSSPAQIQKEIHIRG